MSLRVFGKARSHEYVSPVDFGCINLLPQYLLVAASELEHGKANALREFQVFTVDIRKIVATLLDKIVGDLIPLLLWKGRFNSTSRVVTDLNHCEAHNAKVSGAQRGAAIC